MEKFNYKQALRQNNIAYLGRTRQSAKLKYSYENGVETYGIYLAPATLARDENHPNLNVCPFSQVCAAFCLNKSGHNKYETLHIGLGKRSKIDAARIRKTHLFYDNRELFMQILIHELLAAKKHAEQNGLGFAVRLNCTSDISPEQFIYKGKNILEIFPDIQFYDYTKVPSRLILMDKYSNYHLTFSYDGSRENEIVSKNFLAQGGNVAIVFDTLNDKGQQILPKTFWGFEVEDANKSDTRFLAKKSTIQGLHYHRTANDYRMVNGKYVYSPTETTFIVRKL